MCYYSCGLAEGKRWWRRRRRLSTSSPAARRAADIDTQQRWCQTTVQSVQSRNEKPDASASRERLGLIGVAAETEEEASDGEGDRFTPCRV